MSHSEIVFEKGKFILKKKLSNYNEVYNFLKESGTWCTIWDIGLCSKYRMHRSNVYECLNNMIGMGYVEKRYKKNSYGKGKIVVYKLKVNKK